MKTDRVAIVGAGPAGLMAADAISAAGIGVDVYDAMPSAGRKFLMAGKSGLNVTHEGDIVDFTRLYVAPGDRLEPVIRDFGPGEVITWMAGLGIEAHTGPTGRVFPSMMKASPLLRAWLARLGRQGVRLHLRHRWTGWDEAGALVFDTADGAVTVNPAATVFALGGGSWRRLGSDGAWTRPFAEAGVPLAPFRPSNCGFTVDWSDRMRRDFAGAPVKPVRLSAGGRETREEFVVTAAGVESGGVFTLSAVLRDEIEAEGTATLWLDLLPDLAEAEIARRLAAADPKQSRANRLRKALKLTGVKAALLYECVSADDLTTPDAMAAAIKRLPLKLTGPAPLDEAISTAGGVRWDAVDARLMLTARPGSFVAGEMIDWDAPTGGYLLTACLATGMAAGEGVLAWLGAKRD
ncbi:MAG: TIGR03862 family flavoprotein [Hyphomonas sp.]|uniref:TIGR03862 family flavoprotein n=1 Tax=Hyphomonas sp. TaxID=87 RepID=UPI003528E12C